MQKNEFVESLIAAGALQFGSFTLKSGRISPFFFNFSKLYTSSSLAVLASAYASMSAEFSPDVIFGPAYKGITIASAAAVKLGKNDQNIRIVFDRKEAKNHGEGGVLIGELRKGDRVVIMDDVITAGTAVRHTIQLIQAQGAQVIAVIVAMDRQEKFNGQSAIDELEKEYNLKVKSIVNINDIIAYLEAHGEEHKVKAIQEYRKEYGTL